MDALRQRHDACWDLRCSRRLLGRFGGQAKSVRWLLLVQTESQWVVLLWAISWIGGFLKHTLHRAAGG